MQRVRLFGGLALAALALTFCSWSADIYLSSHFLSWSGLQSRVLIRALYPTAEALVPAVPLGVAFGLLAHHSVLARATAVSAAAAVLRLAFTVAVVREPPLWIEVADYVLLVVFFSAAAWAAARLLAAATLRSRRVWGVGTFAVLSGLSFAAPWLYGCVMFGMYGCAA